MSTYKTGNPLGSAAVRDIFDNAENLDVATNDLVNPTWVDRLNRTRVTLAGYGFKFEGLLSRSEASYFDFVQKSNDAIVDFEQDGAVAIDRITSFTWRGQWVGPGESYLAKDVVTVLSAGALVEFITMQAHVSGASFETDRAAGLWTLYQGISRAELAAPTGGGLIGFAQVGVPGFRRSMESKAQDVLSVLDVPGVDRQGVADSTAGIMSAAALGRPYFPNGLYEFSGDLDALYRAGAHGPGVIRYKGFSYEASRKPRTNYAWMGHFAVWQQALLRVIPDYRDYICDGVTIARKNFATEVTCYQVPGKYEANALRMARNPGSSNTEKLYVVVSLTQRETRELRGKMNTFPIHVYRSAGYTGSVTGLKVSCSREQEQPIISDDGAYTSGHEDLAAISFSPPVTARPRYAPFYVSAFVPSDAIQCSITCEIDYAGVAGDADWITVEAAHAINGEFPGDVEEQSFASMLDLAKLRYESTYSYGTPMGSVTPFGCLVDASRTTSAPWAVAMRAPFGDKVAPGTLYVNAPNDGQDFRITDVNAGLSRTAMAFDGGLVTNLLLPSAVGIPFTAHVTKKTLI